MKSLSLMSIRNKLILIIFTTTMIIITAIGIANTVIDLHFARKMMESDLVSLTELLGNRSSAALAFDMVDLADENLESLLHITNIVQACVYRKKGDLFASYQRESSSNRVCPKGNALPLVDARFDDSQLYVVREIYQKELLLGKIYLASDLSPINTVLWNIGIFSSLALVVAVIFSYVLASWMQGFISTPILNITKVANAIEEKGYDSQRVEITGNDEVAQLAGSFNEMLDALERQNDQISKIKRMDALGQLTGGVAHDYNNMLGVILGYSELLEVALSDQPKLFKYVHEIHHAGERGALLTKKLLSFSKGSQEEASSCNINSLLLSTRHMLSKTLTVRVQLKLDLDEELWCVWVDEGGLEDMILNFSINAMHAIEGSGEFIIQTRNQAVTSSMAGLLGLDAGDYVLLSFKDTGCGMNQIILDRIFEPFFSTKGEAGTGLGLSQAYGYVKQFGGTIKVESQPGEGSIFTLYFHRYNQEIGSTISTEKSASLNSHTGKAVILLVDDEIALLDLSREILEQNGYTVIAVDSAEKALDILAGQSVDLLISDILMPGMDGCQLASIVSEKYPEIKIQLVSGYSERRSLAAIDESLYKQALTKPVKFETLLNRVYELLHLGP